MTETERLKRNEYTRHYIRDKYRRVSLLLNYESDKDIIEELNQDNIQGSIKELIRKGIEAK